MDPDAVAVVGGRVGIGLLLAEPDGEIPGRLLARARDVDDLLAALSDDLARLREPEEPLVEGQAALERRDDEVEVVEGLDHGAHSVPPVSQPTRQWGEMRSATRSRNVAVLGPEGRRDVGVDVDLADHAPLVGDGDDDLAPRGDEAGEVAVVGVDVVDDLRHAARRRGAADALPDRECGRARWPAGPSTARGRGRRPRRGRSRPTSSARSGREAPRPSCGAPRLPPSRG